jgi:phosphate-selective porin OprO and OprP
MRETIRKTILLIITGILMFPAIAIGEMDIRHTDDGIKIETDDHWIKIGGTLMWDLDSASAEFWNSEDENDTGRTHSELRRARLNIKTKLIDNWKAKLQFELAEEDLSSLVKDAYLKYDGWNNLDIIVGQNKEPFGLEAMTSSKKLSFIERSMVTDAFRPGRNIGLSLNADTKILLGQLGIYEAQNREDDGDTYAVTGRLAVVPWNSGTAYFHLGASGSYRDFDGEEFEIKESAEIHTADNIIHSDEIDTDHLFLYGLESAFGIGPVSLQAEYMLADVKAVEEEDDASFDGYYLAASWFLTGEVRRFKNGTLGRVKPISTYGAWELVARYSSLNAAENGQGNTADAYTAGVNWHINSNVRLMADYMHLWLTDESTDTETTGDAVSCRVQCVF